MFICLGNFPVDRANALYSRPSFSIFNSMRNFPPRTGGTLREKRNIHEGPADALFESTFVIFGAIVSVGFCPNDDFFSTTAVQTFSSTVFTQPLLCLPLPVSPRKLTVSSVEGKGVINTTVLPFTFSLEPLVLPPPDSQNSQLKPSLSRRLTLPRVSGYAL